MEDTTEAGSSEVSQSPAPTTDPALGVGTITGNPISKPVRQLILRTVTSGDENSTAKSSKTGSLDTDSAGENAGYEMQTDTCISGETLSLKLIGSSECRVTPAEYNMGIRRIAFASCASGNGNTVACDALPAVSIEPVLPLVTAVENSILHLEINDDGVSLQFDDLDTSVDLSDIGGVAFTVSYIEQRLPDSATDSYEADKITPDLQGARYRICTTRETAPDADMESHCGLAAVRFGDVLWDIDGDGHFGFLADDAYGFYETPERPQSKRKGLINVKSELAHAQGGMLDSGEQETFFTMAAGFGNMMDVTADDGFAITVAFDITDTFRFFDGRVRRATECRGSFTPLGCAQNIGTDTESPGQYDPRDDTFLPDMPVIEAEF